MRLFVINCKAIYKMNKTQNETTHIYNLLEAFLKNPERFPITEATYIINNAIHSLSQSIKEEVDLNCTKDELIRLGSKILVLLKK